MSAPARQAAGLAQLEAVLAAGGTRLTRGLSRAEARLEEIGESQGAALGRHAADTLSAGGKRLRPLIVFLCAGDRHDNGTISAAVAVELVHMATLVHDDVLDRAPLRRGRETVYKSAGRAAATCTGDFLFSRAFAELAATGSPEAVKTLSDASNALARGELMQRADAWSREVSSERYISRCTLKTARLFEAACRLGALFGPEAAGLPGALECLGAFGEKIGIAFQIFDDVLDVSGPAERTGKHRGTDLLDGTITLPLILARDRDPQLRQMDLRTAVTNPSEADALCDRIADTGALTDAREQALTYVAQAKAALDEIDLPARQRRALELVADGVVERYA
ncbi:MAG TPA: polyprenyl synthetase family protein [Thermoleophilaceae bacterium]